MFSLLDNTLMKGAEYGAKYNLNYSVEYDPSFYRCEAVLVNGPWATISSIAKGLTRPVWGLLYYQFNQRAGLETPYLSEAKTKKSYEGRVTNNDSPSWGDLIWAYNPSSGSNSTASNSTANK